MLDQKPPDCIVPDIELPVTPEREEEDEKKKKANTFTGTLLLQRPSS